MHPLLDFAIRLGAIAISGSVVLLGRAIDAGLRAQIVGLRAWAEIHKHLSQHPASPIASKPPSPDSEQRGPGVADPLSFAGVIRDHRGQVRAMLHDNRSGFTWRVRFDERALRFFFWPRDAQSQHDAALGECLSLIANERGLYA